MSRADELPPDQRAALLLLLRQGKSYAEVAAMLAIPEQAVRDRAQAALAMLAPREARGLDPEGRQEIGDYLLGQQPGVGERLRTRTLLSASESAGGWARAVAGELEGLGAGALPEIPPATDGEPGEAPREPDPPPDSGEAQRAPYPVADAAFAQGAAPAPSSPSSRRGGALLLGAIAIAAIVVLVIVLAGGGSSPKKSTATTPTATKSGPKQSASTTLHAPNPSSSSTGRVQILSEGSKRAFYIQAEHIPPTHGFFYAIWLYNSPSSALPLSKSPPVGSSHKLAGAALLPSNAGSFREILLTRETSTRPSHPGPVVLRGPFKLTG